MNVDTTKYRWHRPLQFSLRTLLVLVTLGAVWLGREVERARWQKEVADAVRSGVDAAWSGGLVRYQSERRTGNNMPFHDWLARTLGRDFVDAIHIVRLRPCYSADFPNRVGHAPPGLDELEDLRHLDVQGTDFDNEYLAKLRRLRNVESLDLRYTQVTDEGLAHLAALPELATLRLAGRNISDIGLIHLTRVTSLKNLYLTSTAVTDASVAAFQRTLPRCKVYR